MIVGRKKMRQGALPGGANQEPFESCTFGYKVKATDFQGPLLQARQQTKPSAET